MLKAAQENPGLQKLLSVKNFLYFSNAFSVASHSTSIFPSLVVETKVLHSWWEILTLSPVS